MRHAGVTRVGRLHQKVACCQGIQHAATLVDHIMADQEKKPLSLGEHIIDHAPNVAEDVRKDLQGILMAIGKVRPA